MGIGWSRYGRNIGEDAEGRPFGRESEFSINGKTYNVSEDISADMSLNTFIRERAQLKGTKFMCLEGGCGACIVAVTAIHPATRKINTYAVNSCLTPVLACHACSISTVEDLGSPTLGYHKVIKRLAAASGSQCGYCSPGMVMNMYSLLEKNPKITMKEVENSFGGNICRCTGYRTIMEAFKSFASDAPASLQTKLTDIEDLMDSAKYSCKEKFYFNKRTPSAYIDRLHLKLKDGSFWYRPAELKEVFRILETIGKKRYRFIAGNTGQGVFRIKSDPEVYIDLNGVPELHAVSATEDGISLGASVNLTEVMEFFYKMAQEQPAKFEYLKTLGDHIDLIANVPVRNTGTIGGNLFMMHGNHHFPSDVFLLLEMVNAKLVIAGSTGGKKTVGLLDFLKTDMNKKIIVTVQLPALDNNVHYTCTFKVMPRAQNSHAYVNAGFLCKMEKKSHEILEKPNIIFGGIKPDFIHAKKTEEFLKGRNTTQILKKFFELCRDFPMKNLQLYLFFFDYSGKKLVNENTLKEALVILDSELEPDYVLPDASPEYRKGLALSLFYKFVLSVAPNQVQKTYRSGGSMLQRPLSHSKQDFDTETAVWPLSKPIPKIESVMQCAGEAEFANDLPNIPGELWAQLILADRAGAVIINIDPEEALKMKGVVAFYKAEDIPGQNDYYPGIMILIKDDRELVFAEGRTNYAGEPIGVIIAESHDLAMKAADKIRIEYLYQRRINLDVRKIIRGHDIKRMIEFPKKIDPIERGTDIKYEVKETWDMKSQYHYALETLTCVAVPKENELDLYSATLWPAALQEVVSKILKIPQSRINVHVRHVGGADGMKIVKSIHTAAVTALAAHLLQKPVRMVVQLEHNMEFSGKRFPVYNDYEVGVDDKGVIQYLKSEIYQDTGYVDNDSVLYFTIEHFQNCYDSSNWGVKCYSVKTDTAGNTFCRSPASTEGICIIENIMEHIADITGQDPIDVRIANMNAEDNPLPAMIEELLKISDYRKREKDIQEFNKNNRWKKRGISLVPMRYPITYLGNFYGIVSIFGPDGTVSITHGAVEMGQGVNTKIVQVAAHIFGIETWYIKVKPININVTPNAFSTGGSAGSESACFAVKMACEELNKRLQPLKEELGLRASWIEVCRKAVAQNINLTATHMATPSQLKPYNIHGVTALEVEVDILTGQHQTLRVDLLEDAGVSISPDIDIGQIEGAFVMGMGYYTSEEMVYNSRTGKLLTNRTWNYKPPGAKDIPIDFRITLKKNSANPLGVFKSKASGRKKSIIIQQEEPEETEENRNVKSPPFLPNGDPSLCMSCAILFAIRNALKSARKDAGSTEETWFKLEHPYTVERIWLGALNSKEMFKL